MKKLIKTTLAITVISLTLISCGGKSNKQEHSHEGRDHSEMSSVKYACPMRCEGEKTYSEKGKCPVCEMDLKEVK